MAKLQPRCSRKPHEAPQCSARQQDRGQANAQCAVANLCLRRRCTRPRSQTGPQCRRWDRWAWTGTALCPCCLLRAERGGGTKVSCQLVRGACCSSPCLIHLNWAP